MEKIEIDELVMAEASEKGMIYTTMHKVNELVVGYNGIMDILRDMETHEHRKGIERIIINDK